MSGGSFNYLCYVQPEDLDKRIDDLRAMSRALSELGHKKIAKKIDNFIREMDKMTQKKQEFLYEYQEVMKAVEWLYSGDSGSDRVEDEVKKLGF